MLGKAIEFSGMSFSLNTGLILLALQLTSLQLTLPPLLTH